MNPATRGAWGAAVAYLIWGFLAVYWKQLRALGAMEILAHRVVWSWAFLAGLLTLGRQWPVWWTALRHRPTCSRYVVAALLLGLNWGIYIWSVNSNQIVEASLGYFINPLVSVLLGVMILHERLRRLQWLAVGVAALGVVLITMGQGRLPWIALVLAITFGLYGLAKKLAPLDAIPGLALETTVLGPVALAYLVWLGRAGQGAWGHTDTGTTTLLVLAGVVTSLPLLLFAFAARNVHLTTLGLLQYLSPTCGLWLGVAFYHEPFPKERALGFFFIWGALALFWVEGYWFRAKRGSPARSGS